MTMLSRVAERLYWMARYLERSEDTARLTNAFNHLIMDLPVSADIGWDLLIKIFDADDLFDSRPKRLSEQNVLRFLLSDPNNPSSIVSSIRSARENVRTTRDALPYEMWEYMNELHLFAQEQAEKSIGRRNRYNFLERIMSHSQQINGLLLTTLSRDHAYQFIKMGCLLERADMTTRIIDVGAGAMINRDDENNDHHLMAAPHIWTSLLRALSSISSYREYMGPIVDKSSVVNFVFKESSHPRSVIFCLRGIREELSYLNSSAQLLKTVDNVIDQLMVFSVFDNTNDELDQFIDNLQLEICEIHNLITENWFSYYSPACTASGVQMQTT